MRTIRGAAIAAVTVAAMLAMSRAAAAQVVRYILAGTITGLDGSTVAGAEVVIGQPGARDLALRSDTAGRFVATELTVPDFTVQVRRLGYQAKSVDVRIRGEDHHSTIIIALEPMATKLTAVSVLDSGNELDPHLRDFRAREATNSFGRYIDQVAIDKRRPQFVSEMLRTVPGVILSPGSIGYSVRIRGCTPLVWLDGVRVPGTQLDAITQPGDVAGIEIYSSFAGIPAQFFDRSATCGTILVWSRTK